MLTFKIKFLYKGKKFYYARSNIVTTLRARVKIAREGKANDKTNGS
jgi:hypothetical protein